MGPQDGDLAPDFSLDGVPPAAYHLAEQRGKVVVLAFYPGDFTPVCLRQLTHYEEQREKLVATGATLWAVSTDVLEKHERMAKSYALSFPLLSDPDGKVAGLYGVRTLMGTARRALFLIDQGGVIRYQREEPLSLTYRSVDDILEALRDSGLLPGAPALATGDGEAKGETEREGESEAGEARSDADGNEAGRPEPSATSSRP
jgi:thioredoxin-dependent peroxiredoxin